MTKEQPFSGIFKLDKETKNTVRYAEEAENRRPVVGTIYVDKYELPPVRFRNRFGSPSSRLNNGSQDREKSRAGEWLTALTLGGSMKNQSSLSGVFALAAVITLACGLEAQAPPASADSHPVVESYYKMVPGKADERSEEHT